MKCSSCIIKGIIITLIFIFIYYFINNNNNNNNLKNKINLFLNNDNNKLNDKLNNNNGNHYGNHYGGTHGIVEKKWNTDIEQSLVNNDIKRTKNMYNIEHFQSNLTNVGIDTRNNNEPIKNIDSSITLFYNLSCPRSQSFLTTWQLLKDNINNNVEMIEVECNKQPELCSRFHIKSVPSLFISTKFTDSNGNITNNEELIEGDVPFNDLIYKLKMIGIYVSNLEGYIENFADFISAHLIEGDPRKTDDPDCPYISFYKSGKDHYCADSDDLYGCTKGDGDSISPFDAAFSVVGGYLLALPDNSPQKMQKCARKHSNMIRTFGLCNGKQLSEKGNYARDVLEETAVDRVLNVDYNDNTNIISSINNACGNSNN
jgi:hypothetical protein